jgi:uncharacterized protein YqeY
LTEVPNSSFLRKIKIKKMIKEKVNADYIQAFKEKNTVKKNLLSVVKSEITTIEKNTSVENLSDADVIKILNKTAKSLNETIKALSPIDGKGEDLVQACAELAIIQCYLPTLMSKEEVTAKVTELVNSGITQIGAIMKEFASLPADKKMVSESIKELIKQ